MKVVKFTILNANEKIIYSNLIEQELVHCDNVISGITDVLTYPEMSWGLGVPVRSFMDFFEFMEEISVESKDQEDAFSIVDIAYEE